jgi:hypothetical protein
MFSPPPLHRGRKQSSSETVFLNFKGAHELILRIRFCQPMYSLAGRYDNPIPKWILAHIDCSKIKAQDFVDCRVSAETIFVNIGWELT